MKWFERIKKALGWRKTPAVAEGMEGQKKQYHSFENISDFKSHFAYLLVHGTAFELQSFLKTNFAEESTNWYTNKYFPNVDNILVRDDLAKVISKQWPNIMVANEIDFSFREDFKIEKWKELKDKLSFGKIMRELIENATITGKGVWKLNGSPEDFDLEVVHPLKVKLATKELVIIEHSEKDYLLREEVRTGSIKYLSFISNGSDDWAKCPLVENPIAKQFHEEIPTLKEGVKSATNGLEISTGLDYMTAGIISNNNTNGDFLDSAEELIQLDQIATAVQIEIANGAPLTYVPASLSVKDEDGFTKRLNGNVFFGAPNKEGGLVPDAELAKGGQEKIQVDQFPIRATEYINMGQFYINKVLMNVGLSPATIGVGQGATGTGYEFNKMRQQLTDTNRKAKISAMKPEVENLVNSIIRFVHNEEPETNTEWAEWLEMGLSERIDIAEKYDGVFGTRIAIEYLFAEKLSSMDEIEKEKFIQNILDARKGFSETDGNSPFPEPAVEETAPVNEVKK